MDGRSIKFLKNGSVQGVGDGLPGGLGRGQNPLGSAGGTHGRMQHPAGGLLGLHASLPMSISFVPSHTGCCRGGEALHLAGQPHGQAPEFTHWPSLMLTAPPRAVSSTGCRRGGVALHLAGQHHGQRHAPQQHHVCGPAAVHEVERGRRVAPHCAGSRCVLKCCALRSPHIVLAHGACCSAVLATRCAGARCVLKCCALCLPHTVLAQGAC